MFSVQRFNGFLAGIGQDMAWRPASRCPCRSGISGAPKLGCPICNAKGWFWTPAVTACRAGLSGMKVQRQWEAFGQFAAGDVVITIGSDTPLYAAGEMDRIVMSNSTEAFNDVLTGGEVLDFSVSSVSNVFWLDPAGSAVIQGAIPAVQADGSLVWATDATAPAAGQQFTMIGRKIPEYFLYRDFAQDRSHQGGAALPRRVALRRFALFGK